MSERIEHARMPVDETPLIRVERDIAWLKRLPDIVVSTVRPQGKLRLGPWESLDEQTKDELLQGLEWSGVDSADFRRIIEREVKEYDLFAPPSWRKNEVE